ncbi:MAG TPA: LacI family DNA-binding transcriptional regulator, partial [Devosia sp.]|nr:LacI family DNA-binding transcriptional regulator [Devosia sp.]
MAIATTRKVPTIQDVARHAQVSTATVSRALSSPDRVSETTRARVSEAVHSTGYTVNLTARSLRIKVASTILIAFPN